MVRRIWICVIVLLIVLLSLPLIKTPIVSIWGSLVAILLLVLVLLLVLCLIVLRMVVLHILLVIVIITAIVRLVVVCGGTGLLLGLRGVSQEALYYLLLLPALDTLVLLALDLKVCFLLVGKLAREVHKHHEEEYRKYEYKKYVCT